MKAILRAIVRSFSAWAWIDDLKAERDLLVAYRAFMAEELAKERANSRRIAEQSVAQTHPNNDHPNGYCKAS